MFQTFKIPLTWGELFTRTLKESGNDNILGLAAQLAYYFLLALVPAVICVAALASLLPFDFLQQAVDRLSGVAPEAVLQILREQVTNIGGGSNTGLFTLGFLMAVWSSSAAMVSICDAMNRAYDIEEGRPWWKVRLTALSLTIGVALFVVLAFALVIAGPTLIDSVAARVGLSGAVAMLWKVLQWPVVFALVAVAIGIVNYFAPDAEQDWEWITPGAVLATILWLVASLGFKIYVANFANYNETYGSLGGVIILMLWFYMSGLAVLAGAELNAEIEHASPHGKAVGEKVPGEKKKLGALAAREYEAKQKGLLRPEAPAAAPPAEPAWRPPRRLSSLTAYGLLAASVARELKARRRLAR